jgi:anti-sigma factor RsiW
MSTHLDDAKAQALVDCCLPEPERCACEEHVACCPECSLLVESYRALGEALDGLEAPLPPGDFTDSVMCCIDEAERARAWERGVGGAILGVALAASVALFVIAGAGAWAHGVSTLATGFGRLAAAFEVAGDVLGPVVRVFRIQIAVACFVAAVPLLLAVWRLSPRPGEAIAWRGSA